MKIILFSIGTRGDIEPFLAISQLLKEKGCDVICVFPEQYRVIVENLGLSFKGFSKDIVDLLNGTELKNIYSNQGSLFKRILILIGMAKKSIKISKDTLVLQHHIQIEERPDIILYHPKCNYSILWGMENRDKSILVNPTIDPLLDLGKEHGIFFSNCKKEAVYTMKAVMLKMISGYFKNYYSGMKISVSLIKKAMLEEEKTIYTISSLLLAKPLNCPLRTHILGYYESNNSIDYQPDENLLRFIDKNKKIIFITFGSMSTPNTKENTRIIVNVLKKNNISAIINTSWGGLEEIEEYADNLFFISNIPYKWLFPKVFAVVHHGGSGTTHTALKYGCSCLIIPHVLDQFYWEKTIYRLKLGPKGISIKKFDEKIFEEKILDLYNNIDYKKNAMLLSRRMNEENNKNSLFELITS